MKTNTLPLLTLVLLLFISVQNTVTAQNTPTIWYVDAAATGNNDGTSWANAFTTVQPAVDAAMDNNEIHIAAAIYDIDFEISITQPLVIKGGYPTGGGTQDITNNPTILDAENSNVNRQRVINATHTTGTLFIEAVTLKNGSTLNSTFGGGGIATTGDIDLNFVTITGCSAVFSNHYGGGIYTLAGNITLRNSTIENNISIERGGGIYTDTGAITLINSLVSGNQTFSSSSSSSYGGGIYTNSGSIQLTNSQVTNNTASFSASSSSSSSSSSYGGGIYTNSGSIQLTNSQVTNNTASSLAESFFSPPQALSYGGGIYANSGSIQLTNSQVTNNTASSLAESFSSSSFFANASSRGGAIYANSGSIQLTNSQVTNNTASSLAESFSSSSDADATSRGGAIYANSGSIQLTNSQVTNNTASASSSSAIASSSGGGINAANNTTTVLLENSMLWNNRRSFNGGNTFFASEIDAFGTLTINHSVIKDQNPTGTNNIDATVAGFDPLFVDEANGDYRLQETSPLVNAGNNSYLPLDTEDINNNGNTTEIIPYDLDGLDRIIDTTVDIGPYENQDSSTLSSPSLIPQRISVYPNPTNHAIYVTGLDAAANYSISNMLGQTVLTSVIAINGKIDVSALEQGIYVLSLKDTTIKFVKK